MGGQGVLDIWLAASISLLLLQQGFLWIFLRRKHVQMRHFYIGTPGYLEHKYIRWCREHERGYFTMIIVRVVLIVSIILALIATQIQTEPYGPTGDAVRLHRTSS